MQVVPLVPNHPSPTTPKASTTAPPLSHFGSDRFDKRHTFSSRALSIWPIRQALSAGAG